MHEKLKYDVVPTEENPLKLAKEENRLGKLSITHELIDLNPDGCAQVLSKMLIVRAETFFFGLVEYVGYCPDFEPCSRACYPPEYTVLFQKHIDENETEHNSFEFRKV